MKKKQTKIQVTKPVATGANTKPAPKRKAPRRGARPKGKQRVKLPADLATRPQAIRDIYINTAGANVLASQMRPLVGYSKDDHGESEAQGTQLFVAALMESVRPRNAVEEMLVMQMAWNHARLARLSSIALTQDDRESLRIVNDACDRCAATFRQHMLALAECRRPARSAFVAINQANIAQQQVVSNGDASREAKAVASSDPGSTDPDGDLPDVH